MGRREICEDLPASFVKLPAKENGMIVAIDFDGTIVEHEFPECGPPVPGAFEWMKKFQDAGARLILWTMRSDGQKHGDVLSEACVLCLNNGIQFFGVNKNPEQGAWTESPKAYAHVYIDDAAFGCPLRENPRCGGRPFVDWDVVGPKVMEMIESDD
jgi:hypothetical protein